MSRYPRLLPHDWLLTRFAILAEVSAEPTFTAFLIVTIGGMGTFLGWLIRDYIGYLKAGSERSLSMLEGSTVAMDRLTAEVAKLRGDLEKHQ